MNLKYIYICTVLCLFSAFSVYSQSLPVGTPALEDYYRRMQLLGLADSSVSLMIRPIYPKSGFDAKDVYYPDSLETRYDLLNFKISGSSTDSKKWKMALLPLTVQTQFNSHHPYGWNDGAMIPAKGLQTLISPGVFFEYGPLSIQLKPEIDLAVNNKFDNLHQDTYPVEVARYYDFYNNIDLPARFGNNEISKIYWGQSSIRLNYKFLSAGLSTENLWWGPGVRNSLLMSNTSSGFKHFTLNTRKPVNTILGAFEGQIIAGKLVGSNYGVLEPESTYFSDELFVAKPDDWRYLSGLVLTWQPKWIKGLFVGITRTSQMYSKDLNKVGDYLPFFSTGTKVNADLPVNKKNDSRSSMFFRWLWPEEKAEIYFEYGNNNSSGDIRSRILNPSASRAYIFGLRKILPFNKASDENLLIGIEVAQLQQTDPTKISNAESWYVNKYVRHGYTNNGQSLGAGIGPGANSQTLDISWAKGLKRLGLQLERYVHNNDYYFYTFENNQDSRRHWTDLSVAASGEWNYKNLILNAKLMGVKSLNYQWYLYQSPTDDINISGKDAFNLQIQAGITYRF